MKRSIMVIGPAIALDSLGAGKPDSMQQTVAAVRPIHNEQRHFKRLSRPVHGGRMDPRKVKRVYRDRWSARRGEMQAWLELVKRTFTGNQQWEAEWLKRSQKHNLAPKP